MRGGRKGVCVCVCVRGCACVCVGVRVCACVCMRDKRKERGKRVCPNVFVCEFM